MTEHPAAEHPSPVTPQTEAGQRFAASLIQRSRDFMQRRPINEWVADVEREAADAARKEVLDVERLAATEWAYDTMPEYFDVIRDPVEAWNDRLYPASDHDKDRYRRRASAILDSLARPVEEEK